MTRATLPNVRSNVTPEYLSVLLDYDIESGRLTWRLRDNASWNARFAGKEAFQGLDRKGYRKTNISGVPYRAHRVAWALAYGTWPDGPIDHINGDRTDNRLRNLRQVTIAENQKNCARRKDNQSGVVGVHWCARSERWIAQIADGGRRHYVGSFLALEKAKEARAEAEVRFGFHPNHGRPA